MQIRSPLQSYWLAVKSNTYRLSAVIYFDRMLFMSTPVHSNKMLTTEVNLKTKTIPYTAPQLLVWWNSQRKFFHFHNFPFYPKEETFSFHKYLNRLLLNITELSFCAFSLIIKKSFDDIVLFYQPLPPLYCCSKIYMVQYTVSRRTKHDKEKKNEPKCKSNNETAYWSIKWGWI